MKEGRADKKLDRILVNEDHLRFEARFSFRFLKQSWPATC
jgi:hypothetical protein